MSIKKYSVHAIKLLGASPLTLQQVMQRSINPKPRIIFNNGAGQYSPSFAAFASVDPEVPFDTSEIARVFAAVSPILGLGIGSGLTYTSIEMYYEGKKDLGGRVASLLSLKGTSAKVFLVPRTLTAQNNGEAKLSCMMVLLSADGSTAAIAYTDLVTPPTVVAAEKFTLGPVYLNGSLIGSVEEVTIDFGLTLAVGMDSGKTYFEFCTIDKLEPKISIKTTDMSLQTSFPATGTNLSSGANFYFRQFQASGVCYADNTSNHVKFTVANSQGVVAPGPGSGSGSGDATLELEVHPLAGSSAILAVTTATTIP